MKFQEKLYQLRKEKKMSQEDLANIVGVSRQAVQKWEAGTSSPDMNNLIIISNYFGVTLDNLLKDDEMEIIDQKGESVHLLYPSIKAHYEYKSKRKLFGLPLVHINVGHGLYKAKGILAIGNIAIGLISIGGFSLGLFALGALSIGLIAITAIGLGGIVFGGIVAGAFAAGGIAIGFIAVGGVSIGLYTIGGISVASRIAIGGVANGHIAIGEKAQGVITLVTDNFNEISSDTVKNMILNEYPDIWKVILYLFTGMFH